MSSGRGSRWDNNDSSSMPVFNGTASPRIAADVTAAEEPEQRIGSDDIAFPATPGGRPVPFVVQPTLHTTLCLSAADCGHHLGCFQLPSFPTWSQCLPADPSAPMTPVDATKALHAYMALLAPDTKSPRHGFCRHDHNCGDYYGIALGCTLRRASPAMVAARVGYCDCITTPCPGAPTCCAGCVGHGPMRDGPTARWRQEPLRCIFDSVQNASVCQTIGSTDKAAAARTSRPTTSYKPSVIGFSDESPSVQFAAGATVFVLLGALGVLILTVFRANHQRRPDALHEKG
ncbi:hypothetical protein SPRG_04575 [Saprolegnia parasitica CBS 223.65]|uniref:Uncharacterized protein n=1 Tax=Saprolegnia parasitica (strain CBS 223.65) TaxID=695850 RepID=A0A067CJ04_SAPPC|nr:hypothetical protein SPRG_04575 [Saprolegnia parasitica CBS 223.65]KDO30674.1 hypothetical protein SPRG_04575 [Saprolegnia parasitica CBS 223.65]|eukprot:XP_012198378.1 hypothetical protein SPRG_04575 [Saprolegnia parasitica CBS 223.65]